MYSAVLMLALAASTDTVDFGRRGGCHGCHGDYGCSGSYVGCTGSYGCSGVIVSSGCSGSYGCSASCHRRHHRERGCHGGGRRHHGCHGCHGGHGCSSSWGCTGGYVGCTGGGYIGGHDGGCSGGVIIDHHAPYHHDMKTMPKEGAPKGEPLPPPKKDKVEASAPATIIVSLPADARLSVDGNPTTSQTERRTLITPNLEVGSSYVYTLRAELGSNGVQTQQVTVRGGEVSTVEFNFSTQGVASR